MGPLEQQRRQLQHGSQEHISEAVCFPTSCTHLCIPVAQLCGVAGGMCTQSCAALGLQPLSHTPECAIPHVFSMMMVPGAMPSPVLNQLVLTGAHFPPPPFPPPPWLQYPVIGEFGEEHIFSVYDMKESSLLKSEKASLQQQLNQFQHEVCGFDGSGSPGGDAWSLAASLLRLLVPICRDQSSSRVWDREVPELLTARMCVCGRKSVGMFREICRPLTWGILRPGRGQLWCPVQISVQVIILCCFQIHPLPKAI